MKIIKHTLIIILIVLFSQSANAKNPPESFADLAEDLMPSSPGFRAPIAAVLGFEGAAAVGLSALPRETAVPLSPAGFAALPVCCTTRGGGISFAKLSLPGRISTGKVKAACLSQELRNGLP